VIDSGAAGGVRTLDFQNHNRKSKHTEGYLSTLTRSKIKDRRPHRYG
jgi:hypothetical protein